VAASKVGASGAASTPVVETMASVSLGSVETSLPRSLSYSICFV